MSNYMFTKAVNMSEVKTLRILHGILEDSTLESREAFSDLMKAAFENKRLDPREMADDLGYSLSSIYRWIDGKSAPHMCLWPKISVWVMNAFDEKINKLEEDVGCLQVVNGNGH